MSDDIPEPSQLAIDKLLQLIAADENIPQSIKDDLFEAIPSRDPDQIGAIQSRLADLANNDENQEHPAE